MNVLGFDTSTAVSAACVLRADGAAFEHEPPVDALSAPPAHARELLPAIVGVLARAGLQVRELDAVAVGVGPGPFTGLRIGVSTARALARAQGLELRPVSSLRALASGIPEPLVLPLIDAKRGQVFTALYRDGRELWPALALAPAELGARLHAERLEPLAAGDGSVRFREALEAAGVRMAPTGSRAHVVRGLSVCRLAAAVAATSPEVVLPEYIRPPDAKPSQPAQ